MASEIQNKGELERTLSLGAALSIGVGTMVGAGIFVFPGLAGGAAGPAAIISFLIAGCIALIVAFCTSELATAMPQSGGGYYFTSRTFGPFTGTLVGIGQCVGLVFASSFYLAGFGEYSHDLLHELGFTLGDPVTLIALGTALILTLINIFGTEKAGEFQNTVVTGLAGILFVMFTYGTLSAVGVIGRTQLPTPFAPYGAAPVFTTTALIFTSYLGFVQIATVAGEIKSPSTNLPKALIGSVLIVTFLYVLAIFVSTSVLSSEEMASLGETAMIEVAQSLLGNLGGLAVMGAGLLATLSSANASILSSSRAIFALSDDDLISGKVSKVNERFGTPHVALLIVGISIAGLSLIRNIEVLAEVASLLHLVLYGTICLALISLRRKNPAWYAPAFRVFGSPYLPAFGALVCFGLIFLMKPISIIIGGSVLALSSVWYFTYTKDIMLADPEPPYIEPAMRKSRILIPIDLSDPKSVPTTILKSFENLELVVLGYKKVTDQSSPKQSREELSDDVQEAFEEITNTIDDHGFSVDDNVVFTRDLAESIDRYISKKECNAVLTVKPVEKIQRLLVPVYSADQLTKAFSTLVYEIGSVSSMPVTVVNMTSEEEGAEDVDETENLAYKAVALLKEAGLDEDQINSKSVEVEDVTKAVNQLADEDDLVILGEAGADDRESFFNTIHNNIAETLTCPILTVVRPKDQKDDSESE